jgi:6-phosphogluconolactonase (cycloisomerase 2 family)
MPERRTKFGVAFRALLLVFSIFTSSTAVAQEFVYVANRASNNVSAYRANVFTGRLTPVPGSPFAAGEEPINVVVDRAGRFLYVENRGSQTVSGYAINPFTGSLTAVPGSPIGFPGGPGGGTVDQ